MGDEMSHGIATMALADRRRAGELAADEAGEVPLLKIRATKGIAALNLKETWQFRDLLWTLAGRDVKLRYKQTALGVAWVILQPLIQAAIFTFVFNTVAKLGGEDVPYILYIYVNLLAWNLFASTLGRVSSCLVGNSHLISKVFFPRFVLPLSTIPSTLLDFVIACGMLVVLMVMHHADVVIGPQILLVPFWIAVLLMFAMGIGLWAAALMVSYRDVSYILPIVTQILMWGSAIMISATSMIKGVEAKLGFWGGVVYQCNPIVPMVQGFRWSILGKTSEPAWWAVLAAVVISSGVLVAGAFMFKKMERKFADVI